MADIKAIHSQFPNPCFILDETLLVNNMKVLQHVEQSTGVNILCALKGFSMWHTFPLLMQYISGGTASSLHEVKLINEKMNKKAHSCFVVYTPEEFAEVQASSGHLTFNSLNQYRQFESVIESDKNIAIRINPEFSTVGFEQYNPCFPGSRFGVVKTALPQKLPTKVNGLHFHTLCESSAEDFQATWNHIDKEFENWLHQVKWINLGGGHHITQPNYNVELLIEILKSIKEKYNVAILLEPGEAIGINTGYLTTRIEDIVNSNGEKIAILNTSFAAHMPDCLEMPYKPQLVDENPDGAFEYTFGGNTCMSGDFVKGFRFDHELQVGETIVFKDMMHYTFVKTNFFNGVKHPAIGVIQQNNEPLVLRDFGYKEFKNRLS